MSELEKMLSDWIDLPVSLNVRSAEAKNLTFLFEDVYKRQAMFLKYQKAFASSDSVYTLS